MADKAIGSLPAASVVNSDDLLVMEQDGVAKKLTGDVLKTWLLKLAEGHGGIKSIAKAKTSGLTDTYRITYADNSTFDFPITNGKSITGISKASTSGLVDTYTISFNDGANQTFTVTNGERGPQGISAYVWIKWSDVPPSFEYFTMGDIPGKYMGIYAGTSPEPPEDWKEYMWAKVEGKTAYQFAKDAGYTGNERQFSEKLAFEETTHLLNAESNLDLCIKNGMYYLTGDSQTIDALVKAAGITHPIDVDFNSMRGIVPKAMFTSVTRGSVDWSDVTNPVGQPHQHLRIYYGTNEVSTDNPGKTYMFEFDRVHNVIGYEADGSNWGEWITATQSGMSDGADNGVFIAVYGVTTPEEIQVARNAGKVCFAYKADQELMLPMSSRYDTWSRVFFEGISRGRKWEFICSRSEGWSSANERTDLILQAHLTVNDDGSLSCDKTSDEILNAKEENKAVLLIYSGKMYECSYWSSYTRKLEFTRMIGNVPFGDPPSWKKIQYTDYNGWEIMTEGSRPYITEDDINNLIDAKLAQFTNVAEVGA